MDYSTQMEAAKLGIVTPQMLRVAEKEGRDPEFIRTGVAAGRIAIPANHNHTALDPWGVGEGLSTKVNVNLGVSGDLHDYDVEMRKVDMALDFGVGGIMDLSNCGKTGKFRRDLIARSTAMVGTVPMYDAIGYLEMPLAEMTWEDLFEVVEAHAKDGVDFVTIHAGINRRTVEAFMREGRTMNIVSRGGSLLFAWMQLTGNENPFFEHYDELMDLLYAYDMTISLGDACRPGCIDDATDAAQVQELIELGDLTRRAWEKNVQVMIEGPGHMSLDEVVANVKIEKRLCHNAPFYVLGPLVTDVAAGYDHIACAIGGALAAANGADFLCYVTPAEHLRLPDVDDVHEGIVAALIAAHAADIAKGIPGARERDLEMAKARHAFDWDRMFELAIDGKTARSIWESAPPAEEGTCTMCGKMCAVKTVNDALADIPGNYI